MLYIIEKRLHFSDQLVRVDRIQKRTTEQSCGGQDRDHQIAGQIRFVAGTRGAGSFGFVGCIGR